MVRRHGKDDKESFRSCSTKAAWCFFWTHSIFLDEIGSSRDESDSNLSKFVLTELLVQMEGTNRNSSETVYFIATTNRPHCLDDALVRRFSNRINIRLPDECYSDSDHIQLCG